MTKPTTTIIGAGLCGLAIAYRLQQAGLDVTILEADRSSGGRIKPAGEHTGHQDLGPTWVWPQAQPIVTHWLNELELKLFEQFDSGNGLLDRSSDEYATEQLLPSQYGSARIEGGTHALIRQLEKKLPNVVQLEQPVTSCTYDNGRWNVNISAADSADKPYLITTDRLVVATPPRLAAALLKSEKEALATVIPILEKSETWMAPHAKIIAFYDTAFWREAGLSGRIASHVGPLVEVHDHCGPDGTPAALFGFAGVPADARAQAGELFVDAIKQQLQRCFGSDAPSPTQVVVKDWAFEPFTTTDADRNGSGAHPPVLSDQVRQPYFNNSLWLAGSETSSISAGLIEGALARADEIAEQIKAASQL